MTPAPRVLLLTTPQSYRAQAFVQAANQIGVEAVMGVEMDPDLADYWHYPLGVQFSQVAQSVDTIVAYAETHPLQAILAVDDAGSLLAAAASAALGLAHNHPQAALAARDKHVMRQMLQAGDVPCPGFQCFQSDQPVDQVAAQVTYPCVVKPLTLNGSRGVIRANNPDELAAAVERVVMILGGASRGAVPYLVEEYIPGVEVAVEAVIHQGKLHVLAIFDKPDPLEGPFFEETLYVTPSRLPGDVQQAIADCTAAAAAALGLQLGPVHAELRVNESGPWIVEVAGRSIGGLCSQILQFGVDDSLEEVILRQACGMPLDSLQRVGQARGVMMIPIPEGGILRGVSGLEEAKTVTGVTDIQITARLHYPIAPLPEGDSYLGFIFVEAENAESVELRLRQAHACLSFQIMPEFILR